MSFFFFCYSFSLSFFFSLFSLSSFACCFSFYFHSLHASLFLTVSSAPLLPFFHPLCFSVCSICSRTLIFFILLHSTHTFRKVKFDIFFYIASLPISVLFHGYRDAGRAEVREIKRKVRKRKSEREKEIRNRKIFLPGITEKLCT